MDGMVDEKVYRASLHEQSEGIRETELQCRLTIHQHSPTSDLTCPPVFDNVMCWNVTRAGTNASQPCPGYIDNFRVNGLAIRSCLENGSWYVNPETMSPWTNFTDCFPDQSKRHSVNHPLNIIQTIQVTGYTISIVSLVLALVILLRYRYSQRSRRTLSKITILHINLFIAYILRASISLLRNYVLGREFVLSLNGHLETEADYTQWVCKPITTMFVYALVASTFWLSVEAYVLTKLIVDWKYLQKRNNVFVHIAIGWGGPLFIVVPWLVLRVVTEDDCLDTSTQYPARKHHWCIHQQPFCMPSLRKNLETNISKDLFFLFFLFIARSFFSGYVRLEVPDAFKL